jgi:hypothetical protein
MEFIYDERNPPAFVLDDGFVLDNGFNSFPLQTNVDVSFQPSYYNFLLPGFGPTDPFYLPIEERLYPFRDMTSKIIYLWKDLDPDEKKYIIRKYRTFYPRDNIFYDPYINYGWDNLYRFWYMDGNYIDDVYLNDDGWALLVSLYHYLEQRADKNLVDRVKKECCTRDKHIAEAIWDVASTKVKKTTKDHFNTTEINQIKSKFKSLSSSTTDPSNKEIFDIYNYMWECYKRKERISSGSFKIEEFYKKILDDGIENASTNYKKYLLFKKKYLDKKTLKKL